VEFVATRLRGKSRRALAERDQSRRVRARFSSVRLYVREEQVREISGVVPGSTERSDCPSGSRRGCLVSQPQDSGDEMSRDERDLDRREFLKTTSAMGVGAMAAQHGLAPFLSRGARPNE